MPSPSEQKEINQGYSILSMQCERNANANYKHLKLVLQNTLAMPYSPDGPGHSVHFKKQRSHEEEASGGFGVCGSLIFQLQYILNHAMLRMRRKEIRYS